jgi:hypothetical protein
LMFRNNDLDLTDIGLGNGLATLHGDRLRYIADADKWAVWTGRRWKLDTRNVRFELAKAYVETLDDAVDAQEDDKARKAAAAALNRARSVSGLSAALKSASTVPAMATERKDWDNDPALLLTPDGVVDLRTGTSRPATPDDLMLRAASCAPGGDCPRWLQFVDEICTGDAELVAYLRACVGMSLYGEQRDQVVLICLGIGANGKSTFLDVLHEVFGELSRVAMPDLITAKRNDAHPTEIADLFGARLVICTEAKDGAIDESKIKRLTGGGTITARGIGQDPDLRYGRGDLAPYQKTAFSRALPSWRLAPRPDASRQTDGRAFRHPRLGHRRLPRLPPAWLARLRRCGRGNHRLPPGAGYPRGVARRSMHSRPARGDFKRRAVGRRSRVARGGRNRSRLEPAQVDL